MKQRIVKYFFLTLLGFLSLGAIGGGVVLMISPSGELIGIPLSEYKNMPFGNYVVPGIVLLSLFGIVPLLLILALLKRPESKLAERLNLWNDMHWSWSFSIYVAFALIGWIHIQLIFLQGVVHWLHTFYVFYAILMISIALLPHMRDLYQRQHSTSLDLIKE